MRRRRKRPGIGRTRLSSLAETTEKAGTWPALSVVHPEGFEPTTPCSEDKCSNPLSYGCTGDIITDYGPLVPFSVA